MTHIANFDDFIYKSWHFCNLLFKCSHIQPIWSFPFFKFPRAIQFHAYKTHFVFVQKTQNGIRVFVFISLQNFMANNLYSQKKIMSHNVNLAHRNDNMTIFNDTKLHYFPFDRFDHWYIISGQNHTYITSISCVRGISEGMCVDFSTTKSKWRIYSNKNAIVRFQSIRNILHMKWAQENFPSTFSFECFNVVESNTAQQNIKSIALTYTLTHTHPM